MTNTVVFQGITITDKQQETLNGILATIKSRQYVQEISAELIDTRAKPLLVSIKISFTEDAPEWLWQCKIYVIGPKGAIRQEKQVF